MGFWPLAADYSAMLQNPRVAFRDHELQQCTIRRDANHQPFCIGGQFAVVCQATSVSGRDIAIRAFTSGQGKERKERYGLVSDYLEQHRHLKSLVPFRYHDKGIRGPEGKFYPLVTMNWVSGVTLYEWVQGRCLARDQRALARLADRWVDLVAELNEAAIAHGDLSHSNVMVTEQDELKLVDYDGMCVPKLVGQRNLEIGVEPYQHPERDADTRLSADLDNFSAIFILVVLRALAAAPNLWRDYVEPVNYEKLLIRRQDFDDPRGSGLYRALQRSPDVEVQRLSRDLFDLWRGRLHEVPSLKQMLFSYDKVRSLLSQRNFDEAVALLSRQSPVQDAPPDLQPLIQNARERVQCRQSLEPKVRAGDEAGMKQCYVPRLLDDYPAAKSLADVARHAPKVLQLLQQLQAAEQQGMWEELVAIWDANAALLDSRTGPQVQAIKSDVGIWREKNRLCHEVLALSRQSPCEHRRLAQALRRLTQLHGHPELDAHRPQIELAIQRGEAWDAFTAVDRTPGEQNDRQLIACWNEPLFAGWPTAEAQRPALNQAKQRLPAVLLLRQLVQEVTQATPAGEQQIVQQARTIPAMYALEPALQHRVEQARQRLNAYQQFQNVIASGTSEADLAAAGGELNRLQVWHWLEPVGEQRAQLAEQRAPLLSQLQQLTPALPPAELDRRILEIWQDALLDDCSEAEPWKSVHAAAVERRAALDELDIAIKENSVLAVFELMCRPCLQGYRLPRSMEGSVRVAMQEAETVQNLIECLDDEEGARFQNVFDADILSRHQEAFAPYLAPLRERIERDILPPQITGLALPIAQKAIERERRAGGRIVHEIRWRWPLPRFCQQCLVAACAAPPPTAGDPRQLPASFSQLLDRERYSRVGGRLVLDAATPPGSYIAVWGLVDVGWEQFFSGPLVLGQLGSERSSWWFRRSISREPRH